MSNTVAIDLRWEYKKFLYNHTEWKKIEKDCIEKYGFTMLEDLEYSQLEELAIKYNYKYEK